MIKVWSYEGVGIILDLWALQLTWTIRILGSHQFCKYNCFVCQRLLHRCDQHTEI